MSHEAVQWALDLEHANPTHKLVLVALANHAKADGSSCHPSLDLLEGYTGLGRSTIIRAIRQMEELAILRTSKAHGKRTDYFLDTTLEVVPQRHQSKQCQNGTSAAVELVPQRSKVVPQRYESGAAAALEPSLTIRNHQNPPVSPPGDKPKAATLLPDGFPDEHSRTLALAYWDEHDRPDIDFEEQSIQFRAHHRAKGTKSKDWPSSWVTWYCNAVRFVRAPPASRKPEDTRSDLMKAALR